jgi:hypothetical protein
MAEGVNFDVERDLSPGDPCEIRPRTTGEGGLLCPTPGLESPPQSTQISQEPRTDSAGRSPSPQRSANASPLDTFQRRRKTVSQKSEAVAQFHDSDSKEDVYDLFNACNGILIDGFLDGSRLDELSPEEKGVLNVPRLKEILAHTKTGCEHCAAIVRMLTLIRGTLRERVAESKESLSKLVEVNIEDTIA